MARAPGRKFYFELLFFLVLFISSLSYSLISRRGQGYYNWKSDIWSDKAGYYIYLPALLYYHFDVNRFPPKIEEKTGYGFTLDTIAGKLNTKYNCGVAILISPFFLTADLASRIFHLPREGGLAPLYQKMIDVAAIFYLVIGLWLLKRFLQYYMKEMPAYFTLALLYLGTNILYYVTTEPLMSHIFSFFLFCLFLFSFKKFLEEERRFRWFLLASVAFAMIVLVRTSNIVILPIVLFWDVTTSKAFVQRVRHLLRPSHIVTFLLVLFIVFLPQLLYWHYLTGNYFHYSYGKEGFTNWQHPYILEVWFSTLNGLFTYNPLVLACIGGVAFMIFRRMANGILLLVVFLFITYMSASWYCWYFGCSFGQRSFTEYFAFLSLPFGLMIDAAFRLRGFIRKSLLISVCVILAGWNLIVFSGFERCFFGSTWDWNAYVTMVAKSGLFKKYRFVRQFTNDVENTSLNYPYFVSDSISRSGNKSIILNTDTNKYCVKSLRLWDIGLQGPGKVELSMWIRKINSRPFKIHLACTVVKDDTITVWKSAETRILDAKADRWFRVSKTFMLPEKFPADNYLNVYISNHDSVFCFMDDVKIQYLER